ncbi:MAG: hypothetical protein WC836_06765 [Desulfobacula sp.]|jgi:hypothetical protein
MKKKYPVRFVIFSTEKGQRYTDILDFARGLFLSDEISIHSEVIGFSKAIVEPGFAHRIILILAASSRDLYKILPYRDLLEDRHVILILPDSEKDTMTQALSLYPRYIDYIQNDPTDVFLVLKKMVQKIHGQTDTEKKQKPKK